MQNVLIVGGGSSGWITAAYMDAAINGTATPKRVNFTVLESERIGRIGVGEATIPTLMDTLRTIGVSERDFMKATSATFKHGIHFRDWHHHGHSYFHPFDRPQPGTYFDRRGVSWLSSDLQLPFAEMISVQPRLALDNIATRPLGGADFESPLPYAYHMDAEAFADYLCTLATSRGVQHAIGTVSDVRVSEQGWIESVHTEDGRTFTADLFVDCTGFAAVLAHKTGQMDFVDFAPWLFNDRAVAFRIPHKDPERDLRPYTSSVAMSSGWRWEIDLRDRQGTGYVYSSRHQDEESAEAEIRAALGDKVADLEARHIRFRTGHVTKPWIGNCVSIGLSAGFIEPLESTGIYLIEFAAQMLCEFFPFVGGHGTLANSFNKIMSDRFAELLSFITLHYCLTARTDTAYWRDVQKPEHMPDDLRELLGLWQSKPPSNSDCASLHQVFSHQNYEYILFGMLWQPEIMKTIPKANRTPRPVPDYVRQADADFRMAFPRHSDWLKSL